MTAVELNDDELYSYNELAGALGVTPKTVASYHRRSRNADYPPHLFPRPSLNFEGKHPRWTWKVVKAWNEQRPGPGWHGPQRQGRDDVYNSGRVPAGETRKRLTQEATEEVRARFDAGWSRSELAKTYGVSYVTIARATKPRAEQAVTG